MFARTLLALGVAALSIGSVAAQPAPPAATASESARPKGIVVTPPATVDPRLAKPAPPNQDPGMVQKPPGSESQSPKAPSRQDDCRGTVEDCKQSSPK